jgi:hypothetical protein
MGEREGAQDRGRQGEKGEGKLQTMLYIHISYSQKLVLTPQKMDRISISWE